MARKDSFVTQIASNQSLAANFISSPTVITYLDNLSYQINVDTTNSEGSFAVEGSLDYHVYAPSGDVINAGNWVTLPLSGGSPVVDAEDDTILIDLNQLPFTAIRLVYTSSVAGTGVCNIFVAGRQLGG